MALRRKKPSLAEKIGHLVTAAPTIFSSDDENEQTKAKVVEAYDEADASDIDPSASLIRRRNVDLLDQIDDRFVQIVLAIFIIRTSIMNVATVECANMDSA